MKESSKVKNVLFCIWVIVAILLIQLGVSAAIAIPIGVMSYFETGGDMVKYMEVYTNKLTSSNIVTIMTLVSTLISLIVSFTWFYRGYYKKKKEAGLAESILPKLKDVNSVVFLLAGMISTYSLAVIIQELVVLAMPNVNSMYQTAMSLSLGQDTAMGIIIALIVAPINEELICRGIVIERSKRSFGIIGCIVVSSLMFAFYHMNPIQGLYVLPMGIFWGYIAYKFNSVIIPIIGHIINNCIAMTIGNNIDFSKYWWLIILVFAASFAVLFVFGKKSEVLKKGTGESECIEEIESDEETEKAESTEE